MHLAKAKNFKQTHKAKTGLITSRKFITQQWRKPLHWAKLELKKNYGKRGVSQRGGK